MSETERSGRGPDGRRTFEVGGRRRIAASPERVYAVLADYHEAHPRILPPGFFLDLTVEEGGHGAGTVMVVRTRAAGRVQELRGFVSEPEPGALLVERYPDEGMVTSFRVTPEPDPGACVAAISTVFPRRGGPVGWVEERVVRRLLTKVYAEQLDRVAAYVAGGAGAPTPPGREA